MCACVRVFVRAVSLIGILVAGWGKAESPWRPGAKEKRKWERKRKTIWWDNEGNWEGAEQNKGKIGKRVHWVKTWQLLCI